MNKSINVDSLIDVNPLTSEDSRVNVMEYRFYDEDKVRAGESEHVAIFTLNQLLSLLMMSLLAWMGRR